VRVRGGAICLSAQWQYRKPVSKLFSEARGAEITLFTFQVYESVTRLYIRGYIDLFHMKQWRHESPDGHGSVTVLFSLFPFLPSGLDFFKYYSLSDVNASLFPGSRHFLFYKQTGDSWSLQSGVLCT